MECDRHQVASPRPPGSSSQVAHAVPVIHRRPQAALDILDIWDYIAEDNIDAADRWVDQLD